MWQRSVTRRRKDLGMADAIDAIMELKMPIPPRYIKGLADTDVRRDAYKSLGRHEHSLGGIYIAAEEARMHLLLKNSPRLAVDRTLRAAAGKRLYHGYTAEDWNRAATLIRRYVDYRKGKRLQDEMTATRRHFLLMEIFKHDDETCLILTISLDTILREVMDESDNFVLPTLDIEEINAGLSNTHSIRQWNCTARQISRRPKALAAKTFDPLPNKNKGQRDDPSPDWLMRIRNRRLKSTNLVFPARTSLIADQREFLTLASLPAYATRSNII
ncbi:MAG: hypothetical protein Q9223_007720 [Gallowayella weberi]